MTQARPIPDAVANDGPLDGSRLGTSDTEEFLVAMADGSRHLYVRTERHSDRGVLYDHFGRL